MAQASTVQASEKKSEEDGVDFKYCVMLTQKSTYLKWSSIGAEQRLITDEAIARFLLEWYDRRTDVASRSGICTTCRSLLKLSCLTCGKVDATTNLEPSPVASVGHAPASPDTKSSAFSDDDVADNHEVVSQEVKGTGKEHRMSLRSRRRTSRVTVKQRRGSDCKKQTSEQVNGCGEPSVSTVQTRSSSQVNHCPDENFRAVAEISEVKRETVKVSGEKSLSFEDDNKLLDCEQQDGAGTAESEENNVTLALSPTPRSGRGRPRKYPNIPLECSVCNRKLSTRASVVNHMKKKHPETNFLELYPPASAASKPRKGLAQRRMEKERDNERTGDSKAEDRQCSKPAVSEALKQLRKAELESLKCATCGVQFTHKRQMYTHRRLCVSKVCHLCGKSVKQLEMHLKRHTSARRFPCPHCPKSFLFQNYLEQHMLYHNNERPYCCEICGMRYREKTRLNAHIRTHTGSKPYKCKLCEAAFTRPRGLNDHMRVHTGEKPYSCQVCGRQFSSSGNLAAHRRKVHGLQPQVPNRMTRKLFVVEPGLNDNSFKVETDVANPDRVCDSSGVKPEAVNSDADPQAVSPLFGRVHTPSPVCPFPDGTVNVHVDDTSSVDASTLGLHSGGSAFGESLHVDGVHMSAEASSVTFGSLDSAGVSVTASTVPSGAPISATAGVLGSAGISSSASLAVAVPPTSCVPVTHSTVYVNDGAPFCAGESWTAPARNQAAPDGMGVPVGERVLNSVGVPVNEKVSNCVGVPVSENVPTCLSVPVNEKVLNCVGVPVSDNAPSYVDVRVSGSVLSSAGVPAQLMSHNVSS